MAEAQRRTVGIRDLSRHTGRVLAEIARTHKPLAVTDHGRVVALLQPVDPDAYVEELLASIPDVEARFRAGEAELDAGRTLSAADIEESSVTDSTGPDEATGGTAARARA